MKMKVATILSIIFLHSTVEVITGRVEQPHYQQNNNNNNYHNVRRRTRSRGSGHRVLANKKIRIVANPLRNGKQCEGDCDKNSDCSGNLVCFQRNKQEFKDVPGCLGGDTDGSRTDYCVNPADLDNIFDHDNNEEEGETHDVSIVDDQKLEEIDLVANPLRGGKKCEGDCDEDSDCEGDLICFHRDKNEFKSVPGCSGADKDGSRTDYCIDPRDVEDEEVLTYEVVTADDEEEQNNGTTSNNNNDESGGGAGNNGNDNFTTNAVNTGSSAPSTFYQTSYLVSFAILVTSIIVSC